MSSVKFIPASGSMNSGLMIIGEAPGEQEDLQGAPFVGRSGKLLDKMLAYIDLDRKDVYITNIVKVRPDGNRTPTPEELQSWLPLLKDEIYKLEPTAILTLGNCPTRVLLNTEQGITKLRGGKYSVELDSPYSISAEPSRTYIVPTYHPSYLLRKAKDEEINRQVKEDLKLAQSLLNKEYVS